MQGLVQSDKNQKIYGPRWAVFPAHFAENVVHHIADRFRHLHSSNFLLHLLQFIQCDGLQCMVDVRTTDFIVKDLLTGRLVLDVFRDDFQIETVQARERIPYPLDCAGWAFHWRLRKN